MICQGNHLFDDVHGWCNPPDQVCCGERDCDGKNCKPDSECQPIDFDCPHDGDFEDPALCSTYYKCSGGVATRMCCNSVNGQQVRYSQLPFLLTAFRLHVQCTRVHIWAHASFEYIPLLSSCLFWAHASFELNVFFERPPLLSALLFWAHASLERTSLLSACLFWAHASFERTPLLSALLFDRIFFGRTYFQM